MSKTCRAFYPNSLLENARRNASKYKWAADSIDQVEEAAMPWMRYTDDELWDMVFGNTITRSWMVWSDGYCPNCKNDVRMYNWKIDALKYPWKVQCPHCDEFFPKNDFHHFYRSGLDEHGVFDPKRADRSLLYNVEHPDALDPKYQFGVDDGEGYIEGDKRRRFIGAYLIYGQWKQAILGGIKNLAAAYLLTGKRDYAHKAGVLLDRVADLYPTHDFKQQGKVYERQGDAGYISTWHDACEETREMAMAYDQVFEAIREDQELADFLSHKSRDFKLDNLKTSFTLIQQNIENGILNDAINNHHKIHSNYPRTEIAIAVIKTVLGWQENRDEVYAIITPMIERATAIDGVTGEKGLAGYSAYTIQGLAMFLAEFSRLEPGFLKDMMSRYPQLHKTFRFFIDTWCFQEYYPTSGDTGSFARKTEHYVGAPFTKSYGLTPSMYSFMWDMYELTGDEAFVQMLYHENDNAFEGLPYDLFADDPAAFQNKVQEAIKAKGSVIEVGSINKQEWHLAILRSGKGKNERAVWLDYDSGGGHGHADGMNLGLFAKGLDLMPDFGYPPVQYGGWESPKARWYTMTAAHNTVVVDGKNLRTASGKTTLWCNGKIFRVIRASGTDLAEVSLFERTIAMVDVSEKDFYILDIFRVAGGSDHARFMHSHFGRITTQGLSLSKADDYGYNTQMRSFLVDHNPNPGWSADWAIDDKYKYLPDGSDIHLRYTDLSFDTEAYTCEAWVSPGGFEIDKDLWIPCLMLRRRANDKLLISTFAGIIEPYEGRSNITGIRRLRLENCADTYLAIEVSLANGARDIIIAADTESPLSSKATFPELLYQPDLQIRLRGEICMIRYDNKELRTICLCNAESIETDEVTLTLKGKKSCEIQFA